MARRLLITVVMILGLFSLGTVGALGETGREVHPSGKVRYHAPRGQANPHKPGSNPNLTFHGGPILNSTVVQAVFWGTSWANYSGDKITGLGGFYSGVGGSNYIGTNTEYTGSNGAISRTVTYAGSVVDTSAAPSRAPSTSAVLNAVARSISNPVANGYYPVYTDTRRGSAGYCAWHSWGTIGGVAVQFAFFFNLDADSGCNPNDPSTTHSQGLEALANVSGHELSEAVTDPHLNAWYDNGGAENSDKCAWTFSGLVHLGSAGDWKVQGNWSNAAYNNNKSGYALGGCIQGN